MFTNGRTPCATTRTSRTLPAPIESGAVTDTMTGTPLLTVTTNADVGMLRCPLLSIANAVTLMLPAGTLDGTGIDITCVASDCGGFTSRVNSPGMAPWGTTPSLVIVRDEVP